MAAHARGPVSVVHWLAGWLTGWLGNEAGHGVAFSVKWPRCWAHHVNACVATALLLRACAGPYKVNGVPLRRLNQAYVIATSTKVNLEGVEVPAHIDDAYFARKAESSASAEARFMAQGAAKGARVSAQRKTDQKAVDAALLQKIQAEPFLRAYLNAKFSLTKGTRPHELKF